MRKFASVLASLGLVWGLAGVTPCYAVNNIHSYVSGKGKDTNSCLFTTPCQSLAAAVTATGPGGEVTCLDGGMTFGSFTITKSVTIDCAGVAAASYQLTIDGAGIVVTLRNLTVSILDVGGDGFAGIDFVNGAALFVENCVIENWSDESPAIGIHFAPSSGTAKLYVTDSVIKNNGTASVGSGIDSEPAAGAEADVTIERTKIVNNRLGILASGPGTIHGVVRDSVVTGNTTWGIGAEGSRTSLLIENTTVAGNDTGLVARSRGSMLVSHSSISLNKTGLSAANGGTLVSYMNNNVGDNIHAEGAFTSTLAQK